LTTLKKRDSAKRRCERGIDDVEKGGFSEATLRGDIVKGGFSEATLRRGNRKESKTAMGNPRTREEIGGK